MRSDWTLQASHKVFRHTMVLLFITSKKFATKKFATKKAVKSPKITLIGSTKTKEEVKMSSFIYQKTALLIKTEIELK
jgi:hypothetical protein